VHSGHCSRPPPTCYPTFRCFANKSPRAVDKIDLDLLRRQPQERESGLPTEISIACKEASACLWLMEGKAEADPSHFCESFAPRLPISPVFSSFCGLPTLDRTIAVGRPCGELQSPRTSPERATVFDRVSHEKGSFALTSREVFPAHPPTTQTLLTALIRLRSRGQFSFEAQSCVARRSR